MKTGLWPFFTENHSLLREELLGLPPVPGYRERDAGVDDESASDDLAEVLRNLGRFLLGVPAAMLRGLELELRPRAVVWGPWAPSSPGDICLPSGLEAFLNSCAVPPIYTGFGGMGAESLFPSEATVRGVVDAAHWIRRPRVLMGRALGAKHTLRSKALGDAKLHLCHRDAAHEVFFPRCAVSVHHGGAGTVVVALRAGVPKLAVPLAFDQTFWAQRVRELSVGDSIGMEELTVPVLARALQRLLSSSDVHEGVSRVRPEMPCSARTATDIILAVVSATPAAASASSATAPSRPPLRAVRRERLGSQGAGPRLHVRAWCTREARLIFSGIVVEQSYGDPVSLALGVLVDAGVNLGIFSLYVARTWRDSGASSLSVLSLQWRSMRSPYGIAVNTGCRWLRTVTAQ